MAYEVTLFWRSVDDGLPALVHPGRAERWWWLGDRAAWHDGERLIVEVGDRIVAVTVRQVDQVWPAPGGCVAWGADVHVRVDGVEAHVVAARRERLGADIVVHRAPAGRWQVRRDALSLPDGAARARDLHPFPAGVGVMWSSGGTCYRRTERGTEALACAGRWHVGPHGAALFGDLDAFTTAAAPGRPVAPLPCPLAEPVRFSADGTRVTAVGPHGETVRVDLRDGSVAEVDGVPAGGEAWLDERGDLRVSGTPEPVRTGLREASWAGRGERLAGPGGRIWDLATGQPLPGAPVQLGATVATVDGFATVHWETGLGAHLDPDGRERGTFRIPLDEDDLVVDGVSDEAGVCFTTAMGRAYRVDGRDVTEVEPREQPRPEAPDDLPLPVEADAVIAGRRWGWTTDGLLLVVRA